MGAPLKHAVDIDPREPESPRPRSVAHLALPLQWVGILLAQTVAGALWLDHRFASQGDDFREQIKELRAEMYHPQDANRDLALRDQRIDELTRRIDVLEHYIDGRGHARW